MCAAGVRSLAIFLMKFSGVFCRRDAKMCDELSGSCAYTNSLRDRPASSTRDVVGSVQDRLVWAVERQ